jgi:hypothetical protein
MVTNWQTWPGADCQRGYEKNCAHWSPVPVKTTACSAMVPPRSGVRRRFVRLVLWGLSGPVTRAISTCPCRRSV